MYLLSKILAKEWFKSLIGALIVLFILLTVGDIVNGFLRNYEASRVFLEYTLKMPDLMGKVIPIAALIATLFSINNLKNNSELVAILASGFSIKKFYELFITFSLFVFALQFINLGFIDPLANKIKREKFEKSRKNESKYLARSIIGGSDYLWFKTSDYFASFLAYDAKNNIIKDLSLYYFSHDDIGEKFIRAKSAELKNDTIWILKNPFILKNLDQLAFPKIEHLETLEIDLNQDPDSFGQFESDITTLNFFDLFKFINRLDGTEINTDEYRILLYEKLSLSLICIVFALFPISSVFSPNRRSSSFGKSIIITLIFSVMFWMVYSSFITLGSEGKLPPLLATMIIPFISSIYILFTYRKHQRL